MPSALWAVPRFVAHFASFGQVLLYLPLALDIAGKECMLALSLLLTVSFGFSATLHLVTRNTRLRPLSKMISALQPFLIPVLLLLTLNLYSSSPTASPTLRERLTQHHSSSSSSSTSPASSYLADLTSTPFFHSLVSLARAAPSYWEKILRTSSPLFTILEGLCTLLCIQSVSRFTLARIDDSRSPDLLKMGVLIVAAVLYVGSAYFLYESYGAVPDTISATLIGVAVTAILFLSGISFSMHQGNVIEASLQLAYAVFQIFHLSSRPQMYSGGLLRHVFKAHGANGHPPLPPVLLESLEAVTRFASQTFGAAVDFAMAASSALPFSVIVLLFYRVLVLYAATRVVLALKRRTGGYEDNRKLSEEEPFARFMTVALAYARSLLIAVYTHLLLLSTSPTHEQTFWRWSNVFLVQLLWAVEIRLGQHMDEDGTGRWKTESSSADRRSKFLSVWPQLADELTAYLKGENMPEEAVQWFKRNLDHNTPGGKLNRGISVVDTVEILKGSELTDDEYRESATLGWCIELLQAYFLVADDMMDQSITRRGQPCWYRVDGVGNIAINDAFMLEAAIYYLLKKHFRQQKYYVDILELFLETTFQTELGQLIDLITAPEDHVDLSKFSLEKHHLIVVYKTAYYSFYLPVALAMHYQGVTSPAAFKKALDILIPMGEYFQVQDDYLDCYGTPEQIGKIGTDILDNKCSWLINTAIKIASPEQRKVLDENYGVKSSESEAKVKAVFVELELQRRFEEYEADSYARINGLINEIPEQGTEEGLKREVFQSFLAKVYKRQK
ncbi:hypothetical protein JCM8547_001309 [Rhodosporidiobolus lusitaniae]